MKMRTTLALLQPPLGTTPMSLDTGTETQVEKLGGTVALDFVARRDLYN